MENQNPTEGQEGAAFVPTDTERDARNNAYEVGRNHGIQELRATQTRKLAAAVAVVVYSYALFRCYSRFSDALAELFE